MARGLRIGFAKSYRVSGDQGSYALSGQSLILNKGFTLPASSGAYTETGQSATLTYTPSGGTPTLAQDWATRSSLSNIELAVVWENPTTYFGNPTYVHPGSTNVSWQPDDGILGKGCLNFRMPPTATGGNSDAWHAFHGESGTDLICIQFRVKYGPGRFVDRTGTGGPKTMIHGGYNQASPGSSSSHVNNEEVVQFYASRHDVGNNTLASYRALAQGGVGADPEWFAGTSNSYQNAVDNGPGFTDVLQRYCRYDPTKFDSLSDGCVQVGESQWYTVQVERQIQTPGGTAGNIYRLRIAGAYDSAWTTLIDLVDPLMPLNSNVASDFTANGPTAIWLLGYMTNSGAVASGFDSFQRYDQLLVRRGAVIPLPAPMTLPSWVPAAVNTWAQIPNSIMPAPSLATLGSTGPSAIYSAWNGFAFDQARTELWAALNGGHDDLSWNGVKKLTLGETPAWSEPYPGSSTSQYSRNGLGWAYYNDGKPASRHTGYGEMFDPRYGTVGRVISASGSRWNDGGMNWKFDFYDPATNAFAAAGTMPDVTPSSTGFMAFTRDPRNGDIYYVTQSGTMARWPWASVGGSWSTLTSSVGIDGYRTASAFDTRRNRIFYLGGGSTQNHHTYDIASGVTTNRTVTGAPINDDDLGLVYVESLDAYIVAQSGSGGGLFSIDAGTFIVTSLTTTGGSSIPSTGSSGGIFTKFVYAPRLKSVLKFPLYGQPGWVCRIEA